MQGTLKINIMELINELAKQSAAENSSEFRMFTAVKAGRYSLSVQGSEGHYCSPRKTLPPSLYSDMELAIFSKGDWFRISRNKKIKAFPRYNELIERADGSVAQKVCVFGYVSVNLLNDLYLYLKSE
jgi:hypothetical protein